MGNTQRRAEEDVNHPGIPRSLSATEFGVKYLGLDQALRTAVHTLQCAEEEVAQCRQALQADLKEVEDDGRSSRASRAERQSPPSTSPASL